MNVEFSIFNYLLNSVSDFRYYSQVSISISIVSGSIVLPKSITATQLPFGMICVVRVSGGTTSVHFD